MKKAIPPMKSTMVSWLAAALLSMPMVVNAGGAACTVVPPLNGSQGTCPSSLAPGSSCEAACNTGYVLNGPPTSCNNGVLTAQTCTPSPCAVAAPSNGSLGTCSPALASGGSCEVACNSGYTVVGSRTACSFGALVDTQTCAANACTVTAPANGTLGNCPSTLPSGTQCQVACDSGFTLVGSVTSCTAGSLTAQTCTMPTPPGANTPTDGPLPLWAIGALGAGLVSAARRRFKKAA
jgi:hypothetical protein